MAAARQCSNFYKSAKPQRLRDGCARRRAPRWFAATPLRPRRPRRPEFGGSDARLGDFFETRRARTSSDTNARAGAPHRYNRLSSHGSSNREDGCHDARGRGQRRAQRDRKRRPAHACPRARLRRRRGGLPARCNRDALPLGRSAARAAESRAARRRRAAATRLHGPSTSRPRRRRDPSPRTRRVAAAASPRFVKGRPATAPRAPRDGRRRRGRRVAATPRSRDADDGSRTTESRFASRRRSVRRTRLRAQAARSSGSPRARCGTARRPSGAASPWSFRSSDRSRTTASRPRTRWRSTASRGRRRGTSRRRP